MPTTESQLEANRANAQLSTGPRSANGKARSSQNAVKHGLYSRSAVLKNENPEEHAELVRAFVDKFQPQDRVELRLVGRMADCEWRLMRARYVETATLDLQMDVKSDSTSQQFEEIDEPARLAYAMQHFDQPQAAAYFGSQRQESRLLRQYERAFRMLLDMRKEAGLPPSRKNTCENEPNYGKAVVHAAAAAA